MAYLLVLPTILWRVFHSQFWISLARYQTAKSKHIGIEFEQVDRERNWSLEQFRVDRA
uniref:Uncharacterized protein n=1 Tax=Nelumbo nucifera TaxID=4432 RepID=A0A822XIU6_NELNU|nr:TPA_asm: hypothetical protein HUJ06_020158 [Nelumbo nucifera]